MKKTFLLGLLLMAFLIVPFESAVAENAPRTINYTGNLVDDNGYGINKSVDITFRVFDSEMGGTQEWTETHNAVTVDAGYFAVYLGNVNPLNLDFTEQYWIEVEVDGKSYGRVPFSTSPYAFTAFNAFRADTADVALAVVDKAIELSSMSDAARTVTGDVYGTYPELYLNPDAIIDNIPENSITEREISDNFRCPPTGQAGGVLSGTYPNPYFADDAVTTNAIADGAVTFAKLAPAMADSTILIWDGTDWKEMTVAQLEVDGVIGNEVMEAENGLELYDGDEGLGVRVMDEGITNDMLYGEITADKLADATITFDKVADGENGQVMWFNGYEWIATNTEKPELGYVLKWIHDDTLGREVLAYAKDEMTIPFQFPKVDEEGSVINSTMLDLSLNATTVTDNSVHGISVNIEDEKAGSALVLNGSGMNGDLFLPVAQVGADNFSGSASYPEGILNVDATIAELSGGNSIGAFIHHEVVKNDKANVYGLEVIGASAGTGGTIGAAVSVNGSADLSGATTNQIALLADGNGGLAAYFNGNTETDGNVNIDGTLDVTGHSTLTTVEATDIDATTLDLTDALTVAGATTLTTVEATEIRGTNLELTDYLGVGGNTFLNDVEARNIDAISLDLTGDLTVAGETTLDIVTVSDLNVTGDLDVLGVITNATWNGDVIADGFIAENLTINTGTIENTPIGLTTPAAAGFTTLSTTMAATLNSAMVENGLEVDGTTQLDGVVNVNNDLNVTGDINTDMSVTAFGDVTGENVYALSEVMAPTVRATTALISEGTLDVDGATTLDGLSVSEDADFATNVTVGGNLDVTGTVSGTWAGDMLTDAQVADDLTIDGGTINDTPIGAVTPSTAVFTTLNTNGLATLNSALVQNNLEVDGMTQLDGMLTVNAASVLNGNVTVTGDVDATGTVSANDFFAITDVIAGGNVEATAVNAVEGLTVGGTVLDVDGILGTVDVTGTTTLEGSTTLNGVVGTDVFTSNIEATFAEAVAINNDLTVVGATDFTGDMLLTGNLDLDGELDVENAANFQDAVSLNAPLLAYVDGATVPSTTAGAFLVSRGAAQNPEWTTMLDELTVDAFENTGSFIISDEPNAPVMIVDPTSGRFVKFGAPGAANEVTIEVNGDMTVDRLTVAETMPFLTVDELTVNNLLNMNANIDMNNNDINEVGFLGMEGNINMNGNNISNVANITMTGALSGAASVSATDGTFDNLTVNTNMVVDDIFTVDAVAGGSYVRIKGGAPLDIHTEIKNDDGTNPVLVSDDLNVEGNINTETITADIATVNLADLGVVATYEGTTTLMFNGTAAAVNTTDMAAGTPGQIIYLLNAKASGNNLDVFGINTLVPGEMCTLIYTGTKWYVTGD